MNWEGGVWGTEISDRDSTVPAMRGCYVGAVGRIGIPRYAVGGDGRFNGTNCGGIIQM